MIDVETWRGASFPRGCEDPPRLYRPPVGEADADPVTRRRLDAPRWPGTGREVDIEFDEDNVHTHATATTRVRDDRPMTAECDQHRYEAVDNAVFSR
jgi:hypothetical protein